MERERGRRGGRKIVKRSEGEEGGARERETHTQRQRQREREREQENVLLDTHLRQR